ncbi:MAG: O-antigen ligase family protein [Planctomycetes bacterium]|nr:O-antigen ligase family protein [Planctomycetota bacterium]MCH8967594.1 O-antigen ligase family protein [Planctomycetota bacterium]
MSLTEIIFWFVFIGGGVGAMFNPTYGILVYILVYHLNPEAQWWGANVRALELRTSFVIALTTTIGVLINWKRFNRPEKQFPIMYVMMLAFLAYCLFTFMSGLQPIADGFGRARIDKLMRISIFVFLLIRIIRTMRQYRWLLWSWMAGTIYIGYEAWSGVGGNESGRLSSYLGGADFNQSSGLAAHMVPMTAIAGFLFFSSRSKRAKFFALLAAAFAINTIILTRTRNAVPGMIVLVIVGLIRLPRGLRIKCLVGMLIGLACAAQLTDKGWWARMATLKNPNQDASIVRRYDYWQAAVEMAADYPWGIGIGQFRNFVPIYVEDLDVGRSAHSTYFQCLAELGYPGLFLYLLVIATSFYHFERARRVGRGWRALQLSHPDLAQEQREIHLLATANEVAVCGFLVCAAFTSRLWVEGLWVLMAMSCCLRNIAACLQLRLQEVSSSSSTSSPSAEQNLQPGLLISQPRYT